MRDVKKISLFLDSGAHSLYTREVIDKGHKGGYQFFETDVFWKYVDDYAKFVKENKDIVDVYVNVDVIFNPELTWKVHKYLQKEHGLNPLPVVHYGTDLKWLKRYMDECEYIGLGGLGQEVTGPKYVPWADRVFDLLCDSPDRLPRWKIHGFAMTSLSLMLRYPWWSVDSTSWVMTSRMGSVYVPRFKGGQWIYDENSWKVTVSLRSPSQQEAGQHFNTFSPEVQKVIVTYFEEKGYKIGQSEFRTESKSYKLKVNERWNGKADEGEREVELTLEEGLSNSYKKRDELNIIYFLDLEKSIPAWPWPFKKQKIGFGLL